MADTHVIATLGLDAMRTRFELVLGGTSRSHLEDAGQAALEDIVRAESTLSLFRKDSVLSFINRTAPTEPVRVDGELFGLLRLCQRVWAASSGAFDPTIAGIMTSLGLHDGAQLADPAALQRGFDAVELDPAALTVRFRRPVALDLGAVAKGFALDLAAETLKEAGVSIALLHAGTSSVLTLDPPPGRSGWEVGIRLPGSIAAGSLIPPTVQLHRRALGVSAHHGRRIGDATHIIDPRTGVPAAHGTLAAVTAPSAALADAWSTAALVTGGRPAGLPPECGCWVV